MITGNIELEKASAADPQGRNEALVMHLSPDEAELVEKYRAEKKADRLARELQKTILLLVSGWMAYHDETGAGLTWTTFMDDFDCDKYIPIDLQKYRKHIYQMLNETIGDVFHKCCRVVGA